MSDVEYLTLEDLLELVRRPKAGPVRDVGLLDAAAARARSNAYGTDAYPTLQLKAAALLQSIVRNDALVDGNKRLAWLATVVFCGVNRFDVALDDDEAFRLVIDAATGSLNIEEIAAALRLVVRK